MKKGIVKFFNEHKGFGFIKTEGTGEEIFVHVSGLKDQISENDTVEFDVEEGKKGLNACAGKAGRTGNCLGTNAFLRDQNRQRPVSPNRNRPKKR